MRNKDNRSNHIYRQERVKMSKKWKRSSLEPGDELKLPKNLFQDPEHVKDNLIGSYYIGETSSGIMVENEFRTPFSGGKISGYKTLINWASIYAGHIKIILANGQPLRARLEDKYDAIRSRL